MAEQQNQGQQRQQTQPQKQEQVKRYIYVGPTITELLLVFGKVYKEIPKIPEEFQDLKLNRFFVKIRDYPKKKIELQTERQRVFKQYRAILKQKREKAKGGNK